MFIGTVVITILNKKDSNNWLLVIYSQWSQVGAMGIIYVFLLPESPCTSLPPTAAHTSADTVKGGMLARESMSRASKHSGVCTARLPVTTPRKNTPFCSTLLSTSASTPWPTRRFPGWLFSRVSTE